ncbi:flippase [Sutcliffiella horikoshii]|uniref:flippase n=1 Tax=Sutcliffiella horikoshii TaxID=79883 RepID=UPI003CF3FDC8
MIIKIDQFIKSKTKILKNEMASKIIKNSGWLVSDKIFTMLIGLFVTAIIARYFGPETFGQFNYAFSITAIFTAFSTLGLETLTVKAIVNKDYREGTILCTSLYLRVFGGIILTILASLVIRIIDPNDETLHLLVLIMSFAMVIKSLEVIEYWVQAHQKAKISSIIRMFAYVISAVVKVVLVLFGGNIIHYSLILIFDAAIIGVALIIAYFINRENNYRWKFNIKYAKYILSQSWYLILSGLMVTLYMRIDQVMLGSMLSTKSELGVYSAAIKIAGMWYFVPLAIITSFKPVIMRNNKINDEKYFNSLQLLYTIVTWMGIGFGLIILLFSKLIVNVLYGPEFVDAASILSLSVWAGTFAMLGSVGSVWLVCEGLQKYSIYLVAGGLVSNILLNIALIPIWGGKGAAIATVATQVISNLVIPLFISKIRLTSIMIFKSFIFKGLWKKGINK